VIFKLYKSQVSKNRKKEEKEKAKLEKKAKDKNSPKKKWRFKLFLLFKFMCNQLMFRFSIICVWFFFNLGGAQALLDQKVT